MHLQAYFVLLHFITLHRCCIFKKLKAIPSTKQKVTAHFVIVIWNQTCNTSEVCLCFVYESDCEYDGPDWTQLRQLHPLPGTRGDVEVQRESGDIHKISLCSSLEMAHCHICPVLLVKTSNMAEVTVKCQGNILSMRMTCKVTVPRYRDGEDVGY